ncbi:MAG: type II toxin-antitoxin system HicB family antitoxin [Flavisolibacter sp.]|nr:type II toxin-antitoxin system HicB family antitoxin [Flavisolibacter sp.]
MQKYLVVIEKAPQNYSAFSPDVWGCVATGNTVEDTVIQMKEALQMHLESIIGDGEEIPEAKGISQHIADGVFKEGEIAGQYFITEIEVSLPETT